MSYKSEMVAPIIASEHGQPPIQNALIFIERCPWMEHFASH